MGEVLLLFLVQVAAFAFGNIVGRFIVIHRIKTYTPDLFEKIIERFKEMNDAEEG